MHFCVHFLVILLGSKEEEFSVISKLSGSHSEDDDYRVVTA